MDFADIIWRKLDLEPVGPGIKFVGLLHWEPRMLFAGAPDAELRRITDQFPHSIRGRGIRHSHPLFVLETKRDLAHRVCPCTSKPTYEQSCITVGCRLNYTGRLMDRTSYIISRHSFLISPDFPWIRRLKFLGQVPEECIKLPCRRN